MSNDRQVLVVGSGPTGAMAALTLLQQGIPVTMLESGDQAPGGLIVRALGRNLFRRFPRRDLRAAVEATGDPEAVWYQALAPGGLSNYWTAAIPRFAPDDFTDGARLHERYRWPLAYAELAPYYERVERLLGVAAARASFAALPQPVVSVERRLPAAWQPMAPAAAALGHGLTPLPLAARPAWQLARQGAVFNSYTAIVRHLRRFPHFTLLLGAHALRLEWSGARRRVDAVVYQNRRTGEQHRLAGSAVVLAAGALASARLLLLSASADFPEGLGNTEGLLGRYLHDHACDIWDVELDRPLPRLGQAAYLTRAPYAAAEPLRGASSTLGNTSARDKALALIGRPTTVFGVVTFGAMVPREDGYVRLHPERRDEFGQPILELHLTFDDELRRTTAAARERLLAILEAGGFRGRVRWSLPRTIPGAAVHYGGVVRMHASPCHGVLDGWNRMHAVPNVAVVDAGSFTTGPEKNPTLTAMALAARAAERLASDLKTGEHAAERSSSHAY